MGVSPELNRKRVKESQAKVDRVVTTLPKGTGELIEGLGYVKADFCRGAVNAKLEEALRAFLQDPETGSTVLGYDGDQYVLTIEARRPLAIHFDCQRNVICWLRDHHICIDRVDDDTPWDPIYLVEVHKDDEVDLGFYDDEEQAIQVVRRTWGKLSAGDKRHGVRLELRRYANCIEVESPESFDYDTVDWEEVEMEE